MNNNQSKILEPNASTGICPHCGIYREWHWEEMVLYYTTNGFNNTIYLGSWSYCECCSNFIIVQCFQDESNNKYNEIVHPKTVSFTIPEYIEHYPTVQKLFEESIAVAPHSPRASLALARMTLEALTGQILEQHNKPVHSKFSENIEALYIHQIITEMQKDRMDTIRTIGNKSIHNMALIESDNDITIEDVSTVWKLINNILDFLQVQENGKELYNKVKQTTTK